MELVNLRADVHRPRIATRDDVRNGHRVDVERSERRQRPADDGHANVRDVADDLLRFRPQLREPLRRG